MSKEAMKLQEIMEQAQVFASAWSLVGGRFDGGNAMDDAEVAKNELRQMIEEALAKQEQNEPFGWYDMEHGEIRDVEWNRQKPIYEGVWKPLYTTPQQRTWAGLTDEEFEQLLVDAKFTRSDLLMIGTCVEDICNMVEAKLKEKNT